MSEKNDIQSYALPKHTIVSNGGSRYCVEEVLGAGGFGITYKVSTTIQDRGIKVKTNLAMKELFIKEKGCYRDTNHTNMLYAPTVSESIKQYMDDFLKEAKRLSQLGGKSPNIVQVYEVFEANGTAYYVMEYLDGQDLSNNVKAKVGIKESQALSYIISIAHAVDILHREHILHLDIKPANIVLKRDAASGAQIPVLIDFGVSKHFDKKGKPTTQPHAKGFTEGFAPIEQYGGSVDHFAPEMDIYALGATLYFMITGCIPPAADKIPTTATLISALPQSTSDGVRAAIAGAMQQSAENRTHTVSAFLASIEPSHTLPIGTLLSSQKQSYRILEVAYETDCEIIYKAIRVQKIGSKGTIYNGNLTKTANDAAFYYIHESFFSQDRRNGCEVVGNVSVNDRILAGGIHDGRPTPLGTDFFCANNTTYLAFPITKPQPLAKRLLSSLQSYVDGTLSFFSALVKKLHSTSVKKKNYFVKGKTEIHKSEIKKHMAVKDGNIWNYRRFSILLVAIISSFFLTNSILILLDGLFHDEGWLHDIVLIVPFFFLVLFAPLAWGSFYILCKLDKTLEDGFKKWLYAMLVAIIIPFTSAMLATGYRKSISSSSQDLILSQDSVSVDSIALDEESKELADSAVSEMDSSFNSAIANALSESMKKNNAKAEDHRESKDKAPKEIDKKQESKVTDKERYADAMQTGDWATIRRLANNGYANAYAPLAEHYLSIRDYSAANTYAQKAKSSGVGSSRANAVIAQLKRLGYYDFND